jgi:transposase
MTEPLERVATIYLAAVNDGLPPIKAVQSQLNLSRGTAIRRIRSAREKGYLDEGVRPGAPHVNHKVVAVAKALGLDPKELSQAIIDHADGDIRIK